MPVPGLPRAVHFAYRTLLRLLPRDLRRRYADDMYALVADRIAALGTHAALGRRLRIAGSEFTDLLRTIVSEHRRGRIARLHPRDDSRIPNLRDLMIDDLVFDVRFAFRSLAKRPLFTVVIVAIVALGIGATTAVFTLYQSVLLRPLPYADPGRLVYSFGSNPNTSFASIAPADFLDYRERARTFEQFAAFNGYISGADLTGDGVPTRLELRGVSHNFFDALGLPMTLGREFTPEEESAGAQAIVLSHDAWQQRFGADRSIVGRSITLDGEAIEVIGVAPSGLLWFAPVDGWTPLAFDAPGMQDRRFHFLRGIARLRRGVDMQSARTDLDAIAAELGASFPETNEGWALNPMPLRSYVVGDTDTPLTVLLGAVIAVLLIACSNVATMILTRSTTRSAEIAVRAALGASSGRVARLVLTECLVLAVAGGALGTWLGARAVSWVATSTTTGLPGMTELRVDPIVLTVSLSTTILAGVFFGLLPTTRLARGNVAELLRGAHTTFSGNARARRVLIATQVALSTALLLGAALLLRSLWSLEGQDPGFSSDGIVTASIALPDARYGAAEEAERMISALIERVAAAPGIVSAGGISMLPFTGGNDIYTTRTDLAEDDPANGASPQFRVIEGDYFETVKIPFRSGRRFGPQDRADTKPVVIIDEQMARALFGNDNPLGEQLRVHLRQDMDVEIVGLVGDILHFGLGSELYAGGTIYLSARQMQDRGTTVVARSTDADAAVATIRSVVGELDPLLPISRVQNLDTLVNRSVAGPRFRATIVTAFAATALLLATVGLYGAMSYWVSERRREIGVRIALGAHEVTIVALFLRRGLALVGIGLLAGAALALAAGRFLTSMLVGVTPSDPMSFVVVVVTLALTGSLACLLPALRASRVDPVDALRDAN